MVSSPPGGGPGHSEIPGADGSDFYAPSPDKPDEKKREAAPVERRMEDRRKSLQQYFGEERRREGSREPAGGAGRKQAADKEYRLRSKSETLYPTAFIPVSKEFYNELTQEQRDKLMKLQAIAQEKAGYEKGTPKFFIEDFDPSGASPVRSSEPADPVADAAPRLVVGGALLGAGVLAFALAAAGLLPGGVWLTGGIIAALGGVGLAFTGR